MRRFSCNVSQKKGGFPVQIGVLVQRERKTNKKAIEVNRGFFVFKIQSKNDFLLLISYLFPKLTEMCPKEKKFKKKKKESKKRRAKYRHH